MKIVGALIFILTILSLNLSAQAQTADASANKLEKNVSFEDMLIQGKFHFTDESVTTVEQEKVLDGLLGVRKDFKDKVKKSASRN